MPAGISAGGGRLVVLRFFAKLRDEETEMRWPMSKGIDDDSWVMGVMEPIVLLLLIALVAALANLL
jgi:hypothetical protein